MNDLVKINPLNNKTHLISVLLHLVCIRIYPQQNDLNLYLCYQELYLCRQVLDRDYTNPAPDESNLEHNYTNLVQVDFKINFLKKI